MEGLEDNRRYSIAEYVQQEQVASQKHEYREGLIVPIGGGPLDHSLIIANVLGEIGNRLKGKPCRVYESNLRIRIPRKAIYTYPDAAVICGTCQADPADPTRESATNPRLIVEVLSPSTEAYDRGEKFSFYRSIPSLEEYVLVSQATPRIEVFRRQSEGTWLFTWASGLESSARLHCLEIDLPLAEAYAGIEWPPPSGTGDPPVVSAP